MKNFLEPHRKDVKDFLDTQILKRFKEGRGQGLKKYYKPYLTVRDVPSKGRVHRRPAITHGRVVHLLSDLELTAFLINDWCDHVTDIREQFPLPPEETINICNQLKIKHPSYNGVHQIVTTDLLINYDKNNTDCLHAISVKYTSDLEDKRTIEKLEIERRYWEGRKVQWAIFTENEVQKTLLGNIKWLISHVYSFELSNIEQSNKFEQVLHAIQLFPEEKISKTMRLLDDKWGTKNGTYLKYIRHLFAQHAFYWDIENIHYRSLKTSDIKVSDSWKIKEQEYVIAK